MRRRISINARFDVISYQIHITMATALTAEELMRGLECPVCQDHYQDPRMLPCGHTLCMKPCLEQVVGHKRSFQCPECRTEHAVPDNGIEGVQKNLAISRLVTGAKLSSAKSSLSRCPSCGDDEQLFSCGHCQLGICYGCMTQHITTYRDTTKELAGFTLDATESAPLRCTFLVEKITEIILNQAEQALSDIDAAAEQAISLVERKTEDLKKEVLSIRQEDLSMLSGKSQRYQQAWGNVAAYSRRVLTDLEEDRSIFSAVKLAKINDKLLRERENASEIKLNLDGLHQISVVSDVDPLKTSLANYTFIMSSIDENSSTKFEHEIQSMQPRNAGPQEQIAARFLERITSDIQVVVCSAKPDGGQPPGLSAIAVDDNTGDVVVIDANNHRIQRYLSSGKHVMSFGSFGYGPEQFNYPFDLAITKSQQIVISDSCNHRVKIHNMDGSLHREIGKFGKEVGMFRTTGGLALDSNGDVHVCDLRNRRVQILSQDGVVIQKYCPLEHGRPAHIRITSSGMVCVAGDKTCTLLNSQYQRIQSWDIETTNGICAVENMYILIANVESDQLCVYEMDGNLVKVNHRDGGSHLKRPRGLATDRYWDTYVACKDKILKF